MLDILLYLSLLFNVGGIIFIGKLLEADTKKNLKVYAGPMEGLAWGEAISDPELSVIQAGSRIFVNIADTSNPECIYRVFEIHIIEANGDVTIETQTWSASERN